MADKEIKSVNESSASQVFSSLSIPGALELVIYLLAGIIFVALVNIRALWNAINSSVQTTYVDTSSIIDETLINFGDRLNGLLEGRPGQMLFWAIVGCLIYMLIWLSQNFIINLRNDVVADKYLHPNNYKSSSYWEGVLAHKIFFVTTVVVLFLYVFLSLTLFIPILSKIFKNATFSFSVPSSIIQLVLITLLSAIMLYLAVFIVKLVAYSWRAVINNF